MLFNSLEFLFFLAVVFALYFLLPPRFRWILLLIASYCFYASWKAEYALLLAVITLVIYITAIMMEKSRRDSERKRYLWISVIGNLGILFVFKYFGLFNETVRAVFSALHIPNSIPELRLLLPVGISFYTFQALSYTIDVYRGKRPAEKHLGILAVYVSFFPQVLAGPIERSTQLLPQFRQNQIFQWNDFKSGFLLMLWGYYQKVVIADRLSIYVNQIYSRPAEFHGAHLLIGTLFFPMQLYCDFAGYSNIAIGIAQMLGFKLMKNFDRPFTSGSIRDFVLRWHISLTRWIMDYVYFPLAKKATKPVHGHLLVVLVMVLIWLWHGASWNFVLAGISLGLVLVQFDIRRKRKGQNAAPSFSLPGRWRWIYTVWRTLRFYLLAAFVWGIVFRSGSIANALLIWGNLFRDVKFSRAEMQMKNFSSYELVIASCAIIVLQIVEWLDDRYQFFAGFRQKSLWLQYVAVLALLFCILMLGEFNRQPFIYFQF